MEGKGATARIVATGIYAPGQRNRQRGALALDGHRLRRAATGVADRDPLPAHRAPSRHPETTADFAEKAARAALEDAGVQPADVGPVRRCNRHPRVHLARHRDNRPGRLQGGETDSGPTTCGASCASFVTALDAVSRAMVTDRRFATRWWSACTTCRRTCGPATSSAGRSSPTAQVQSSGPGRGRSRGYIDGVLKSDGTQWNYVGRLRGGTRKPVTKELLDAGTWGLELLQRLPGDRNVKLWPPTVHRLLAKAGRRLDEVDHLLFTQINRSVIDKVMAELGLPRSRRRASWIATAIPGRPASPWRFTRRSGRDGKKGRHGGFRRFGRGPGRRRESLA